MLRLLLSPAFMKRDDESREGISILMHPSPCEDCHVSGLGGDLIGILPNRPSWVAEGKVKDTPVDEVAEDAELGTTSFGGGMRNIEFME